MKVGEQEDGQEIGFSLIGEAQVQGCRTSEVPLSPCQGAYTSQDSEGHQRTRVPPLCVRFPSGAYQRRFGGRLKKMGEQEDGQAGRQAARMAATLEHGWHTRRKGK
jgi:hypothetical protein